MNSPKMIDLVKKYTVFTQDTCTCEYCCEYAICWHIWWAFDEWDRNAAKLKVLREKRYVPVPKLGRKKPKASMVVPLTPWAKVVRAGTMKGAGE